MQWWHASLQQADPDQVAASQDVVSTQHMEEQFYHPATVAHQVDLWRRPGMPLWCYGNTVFQDDGSGGETYRELMTGLARGCQGLGRNFLPAAGSIFTESNQRIMAPVFRLFHIYGGLSAASVPDDQVAVWRSLFQEASEVDGADHLWTGRPTPRRHFFNTSAAYTACLYAHLTAGIVTDERVRTGDLTKYKAVIVSFERKPPDDLVARLSEFQSSGGIVLANKPADGYWAPPNAVELGSLFGQSFLDFHHNEDMDRFLLLESEEGGRQARALREAVGERVKPIVDCDDPTTWLSVLASGKAKYIFAVNLKLLPIKTPDLHRFAAYQNTVMPTKTVVRIRPGDYVIYDVLQGKLLTPQVRNGHWIVEADMSILPGALFALIPAPVANVSLAAGISTDNRFLEIAASVQDKKGVVLDAAIPLKLTVTDASGKKRFLFSRTARHGRWRERLPVTANDVPGQWTIAANELLGGNQSSASLTVAVPKLPVTATSPQVEWSRGEDVSRALAAAGEVAIIVDKTQRDKVAPVVTSLKTRLSEQGKRVTEISSDTYLADRKEYGWEAFKLNAFLPEVRLRPRRYDLVIALELPDVPSRVVPWDQLPIVPTATDPGPDRGLVQFVAMPVYDTEDAISLAGGDVAGLSAAVESLWGPPAPTVDAPPEIHVAELPVKTSKAMPPTLNDFIGVPAAELAVSGDGQRIAVGMKGWGNNLVFLNGKGEILAKHAAGKLYPLRVQAIATSPTVFTPNTDGKLYPFGANDGAFGVLEHEIDPTVLYYKLYGRDGRPLRRLAAFGRRIGGTATVSMSHPTIMPTKLLQASFSITPDGRLAAVSGSTGVAVWNLPEEKLLWSDEKVHFDPDVASIAPAFPQVQLSRDGESLAQVHRGKLVLREALTGKAISEVQLPLGASPGRVQQFDGRTLVVGDNEFFAVRDGELLWRSKLPLEEVAASGFAADCLHYAIGQPNGTLRIFAGGQQVGGYVISDGGLLSLAITSDGSHVAFASTTGCVGVVTREGREVWQDRLDTRAAIAWLGHQGETVVGDWRGRVHRYTAAGLRQWTVNLSSEVWRNDLNDALRVLDTTPTLRVPPPEPVVADLAKGKTNLATSAQITFVPGKTGGWQKPIATRSNGGAVLNDGRSDEVETPWFDERGVSYMVGSEVPMAWEFSWPQAVSIDRLVVHESSKHAEAVPQEIAVEAWIEDADYRGWKRVRHDRWTRGVEHTHRFDPVLATKLRYIVYGDFGNNLWTSEIEAYGDD